MITDLEKAIYQVLTEAQDPGEPLENVAEIAQTNLVELEQGGITLGGGEEFYQGGSGNQRDFNRAEIEIHCVVKTTRSKKFRQAEVDADGMAKSVRKVLKGNLKLTSTEYPGGFLEQNLRIVKTHLGYGKQVGSWVAIATVTIGAFYNEEYA